MHASQPFASSPHCKPSPDGRYVATVGASTLSVRSVATLRLVNVVKLAHGAVCSLLWSPSSCKVLVATVHEIHVFSAADASFHVSIQSPASVAGRAVAVYFGARDSEVFVATSPGLKFSVLDLSTSKVVEIGNPKFQAFRGFCLCPPTGHLALLTRVGGKDFVSLHHPITRQVERSWSPDTVDAQGLIWTPDGQWLLLWESPAHGHRLLLYTSDGQHFRTVGASSLTIGRDPQPDRALELGVKSCQLSPNAQFCAVGNHSRGVALLSTQSWRETMRLMHPTTIVPRDTTQVWQEQLDAHQPFLRATRPLSPSGPSDAQGTTAPLRTGCSLAGFDASSTLMATRLDDSPSTLWIWDLVAAELRAVLLFHSHVSFKWHPSSRQLLLVNCQDEVRRGASFVWDPVFDGPTSVSPEHHLPRPNAAGKSQAVWVNRKAERPSFLLSDAEHFVLLSLSGPEQPSNPWHGDDQDDEQTHGADDASTVDDTFFFKKT